MTSGVLDRAGHRQEDIDRTLRMVASGYSKLTARMISHREGWTMRTVMLHLRHLENLGFAEPVAKLVGKESAWRATPAGKEHLHSVTSGAWATTVREHPATLGRDQHNGN